MDWMRGDAMKPDFIDIPVIDFNTDYGMQRSFSEGDIMVSILNYCFEIYPTHSLPSTAN